MSNEKIDPEKTKTIIKVVIAILSAILGALGESQIHAFTNLLNF